VLFNADGMKLFLPVRGFQDCLKIQGDLNSLVYWCGANVGKCKSTTLSSLRHPVEFSYMLGGIFLDRVDSITDLGVLMDSIMSYYRHINITDGKALAMLGFVKRFSGEFKDPHNLGAFFVSFVRPNYASCMQKMCGDLFMICT
jgi:hypothetical protein